MFHGPEKYHFKDGFLSISVDGVKFLIGVSSKKGFNIIEILNKDKKPSLHEIYCLKNIFWDKEDIISDIKEPEVKHNGQHYYCLELRHKPNTESVE